MPRAIDLAVVGASGLVGEAILEVLAQRAFPIGRLHLLAAANGSGKRLPFGDGPDSARYLLVGEADAFDFSQVQLVLMATPAVPARLLGERALAAGCVVVDVSSCHRTDGRVPLVVPEVNGDVIPARPARAVVAVPGAAATMLALALAPIGALSPIVRVSVTSLQSVSGAGRRGVAELARQTAELLNGSGVGDCPVFGRQIAFNVLPAGALGPGEPAPDDAERQLVGETRRLLGERLQVNATCLRVPWFHGDAMAVHLETAQPLAADRVAAVLSSAAGIRFAGPTDAVPSPVEDAAGSDVVWVSQLGATGNGSTLRLWLVADNVRRGAALTAVQTAERLLDWLS